MQAVLIDIAIDMDDKLSNPNEGQNLTELFASLYLCVYIVFLTSPRRVRGSGLGLHNLFVFTT